MAPPTAGPLDPCPSGAEWTAFAAGEGGGPVRAALSRHLLRCAACRAAHGPSASVLGRLREFGDTPGWESDLARADAARRAERRRGARAALGGLAAAAALAALALGAWWPRERPASSADAPVAAARALPRGPRAPDPAAVPATAALLRAQGSDGRWSAGPAGRDEAATGLAVLALLEARPARPAEGATGRALAAAVRWLRSRQEDDGGFAGDGPEGVLDRAVATEALVAVGAVSGDASLRRDAGRAARRLARDALGSSPLDPPAAAWAARALERARAEGVRGLDEAVAAARDAARPASRTAASARETALAALRL